MLKVHAQSLPDFRFRVAAVEQDIIDSLSSVISFCFKRSVSWGCFYYQRVFAFLLVCVKISKNCFKIEDIMQCEFINMQQITLQGKQ